MNDVKMQEEIEKLLKDAGFTPEGDVIVRIIQIVRTAAPEAADKAEDKDKAKDKAKDEAKDKATDKPGLVPKVHLFDDGGPSPVQAAWRKRGMGGLAQHLEATMAEKEG